MTTTGSAGTGGTIGADAQHPLAIEPVGGEITATAYASLFLDDVSGNDTSVNQLESQHGDVTLISLGSILDGHPGDFNNDAIGNNITLTAGILGTIGAPGGEDFKVDTAFSGPGTLTSTSGLNTFVEKLIGDLSLYTVATTAGTAFILAPDGKILNGNTSAGGNNILAGETYLFASLDIGTSTNPITAEVGNVQGESTSGNAYLSNTGSLIVGGVVPGNLIGFKANGKLQITTHSPIEVSQDMIGSTVTLIALDKAGTGDTLIVDPGVTVQATAGDVVLSAGDDLTIPTGAHH